MYWRAPLLFLSYNNPIKDLILYAYVQIHIL